LNDATTLLVALALVADISVVTDARSVVASIRDVKGRCVAEVVGASIVIVTEVGRDRIILASSSSVTRIISTSVVIIANNSSYRALGEGYISRVLADIRGAVVTVIALGVVIASRNRRAQVGEVNNTGEWVALVVSTWGVGGNRHRGDDATLYGITSRSRAKIRGSARRNWVVLAHSGGRNLGVGNNTSIISASVVVIAVHINGTLRNWAFGLINGDTINWIARGNGATISYNRERDWGLLAAQNLITSSGVANINGIARDCCVRAEVEEWVGGVGHITNVIGAHVHVITGGVVKAVWNRANGVESGSDVSCGGIARVGKADSLRRNWHGGDNAARYNVAPVGVTLVCHGAVNGGVVAHGGRRNLWVQSYANVSAASIVVIAVSVDGAFRDRAFGLIENNSLNTIASNGGTTIGDNRKRNDGLDASHDFITSSGVAGIRSRASDGSVCAVGTVRISWVFELTRVHGAGVVVIANGGSSGDGANRGAKIRGGSGTRGGVARISCTGGVRRKRVSFGNAITSTALSSSVTSVGLALVVDSRNAGVRGLWYNVATSSNECGRVAEVLWEITTINRRTLVARAETTASGARGSTSTTRGLARGGNETSRKGGQVVPVGSSEHVFRLVVGNDEQLSGRIDLSDSDSEDDETRNSSVGVVNSPLEIGGQGSITSRFSIFGTRHTTDGD